MSVQYCYVFDIDGTLADASHRLPLIKDNFAPDWDAFFDACDRDEPIWPIITLLKHLAYREGNAQLAYLPVVLVTGRPERIRRKTVNWCRKYTLPVERLYMRADGDHRPDYVVKGELADQLLADGYRPTYVFEDRSRVVQMWREKGYVCLQVAEGNY